MVRVKSLMCFIKKKNIKNESQVENRFFSHTSADLAFRALSDSCKNFKNSEKAALKQFMEK